MCVHVCAIARPCPTQRGNLTDYILVPGHIVKTLKQQNKTILEINKLRSMSLLKIISQ